VEEAKKLVNLEFWSLPMLEAKFNTILLGLAEQEKEHGYFVLATKIDFSKKGEKFHRVPSQWKGARLLCFGCPILRMRQLILKKKHEA